MRLKLQLFVSGVVLLTSLTLIAQSNMEFVEQFALAEDRAEVLTQLIPGSKDYYYYHSLHYVNESNWKQLDSTMQAWRKRHGETRRYKQIENRSMLLRYPKGDAKPIDYLVKQLNLKFNHQQQKANEAPDIPTELDQDRISWQKFWDREKSDQGLNQVNEIGIDRLLRNGTKLSADQKRSILRKIQSPDYPDLVQWVAEDLRNKESRGFGELQIHAEMLPEQLDRLAKAIPQLKDDQRFIQARIRKMRPSEDINWSINNEARGEYLDELWKYVKTLSQAHNSLKAHALFQQLRHYRDQGEYPSKLWIEYLKLPRQQFYYRQLIRTDSPVDLSADFRNATGCSPIRDDEPIVREFLSNYFIGKGNYESLSPYLDKKYLQKVFAETKLMAGEGEAEQWFSMLTPGEVQQLKNRVEIDFAPENKEQFLPSDEVELALDIKNVKNLVINIYEINQLNYYLDKKREIASDLTLDGLVASEVQKVSYDSSPILKQRQNFKLDSLKGKRGTWIVEFIGNGVSSRAVIRKGKLQYLRKPTATGDLITILDENNQAVKEPSVWFGAKKYFPDDDGNLYLPFSKAGRSTLILFDGNFASLDQIQLSQENYQFSAGFSINREALIQGGKASLLIRAQLQCNGETVPISLLEQVALTISSVDMDGIDSSETINDFKLLTNGEAIFRFNTPRRLASLNVKLGAKLTTLSGKEQRVSDRKHISFDSNHEVADLYLTKDGKDYLLKYLGKSGEPVANRGINLSFSHTDFREAIDISLRTDENGTIGLGQLKDITTFFAHASSGAPRVWSLRNYIPSLAPVLHGVAGKTLQVSLGELIGEKLSPLDASLFEIRSGTPVSNQFDKLSYQDGLLSINKLEPADYKLYLKKLKDQVDIRITKPANAESLQGYLLSNSRHLEATPNSNPIHINEVKQAGDQIVVSVANAKPGSRVHIYATRFYGNDTGLNDLTLGGNSGPSLVKRQLFSSDYFSGRDIGDEYRYIIDRRSAKKYPGNFATRSGLLLNPWKINTTSTDLHDLLEGEDLSRSLKKSKRRSEMNADRVNKPKPSPSKQLQTKLDSGSDPNYDFLASEMPVVANLIVDENGEVKIDRKLISEDRNIIHALAIDAHSAAYKQLSLDSKDGNYRDLSLGRTLDPTKHFTQGRKVSILRPGEKLIIDDVRSSEFKVYNNIKDVFNLLNTSGQIANGNKFAGFLDWPSLDGAQKQKLYSKYACHEVNFFLSRRDKPFFTTVIAPYIANKHDKTFLDHYLLEEDLTQYLEPWRFSRLNIVEQILLGKRLDNDQNIPRSVTERYQLIPEDYEAQDHLFQTMLRGLNFKTAFATGGVGGGALDDENEDLDGLGWGLAAPAPAAVMQPAQEESILKEEEADAEMFFSRSAMARGQSLFTAPETTSEWAENNYYQLPIAMQLSNRVNVNAFWKEFANWNGENGFYSSHFLSANESLTEAMFAIALLDLPFEGENPDSKLAENTLTLTAKTPLIIYVQEVSEVTEAKKDGNILISQNFFQANDRTEVIDGKQSDKFVTKEFLTGVLYGTQVVITNPSSAPQNLGVLAQIPEGAIPLAGTDYTKTIPVQIGSFSTEKIEVYFYFPETSGKDGFAHFPVHVSRKNEPIAWVEPTRLTVVDKLSEVDETSWQHLSQFGSNDQVIAYLEAGNIHKTQLEKIAWRLQDDADFLVQLTDLLRSRKVYSNVIWKYGLRHKNSDLTGELLLHQEAFLKKAGPSISSDWVHTDPIERHWYQHLEYFPLVNARVHPIGRDRKILNDRFSTQYSSFLDQLCFKNALGDKEKVAVVYYLLLQDRIEEGIEWFESIDREKISGQMQYDYLDAYFALYQDEIGRAKVITNKYTNYQVERWRSRFELIGDQVNEIEGKGKTVVDGKDRTQVIDQLAESAVTLEIKRNDNGVDVQYRNTDNVTLNYYEMDLEFLFSNQPFVSAGSGQFSYIRPNLSEQKELDPNKNESLFRLPVQFEGKNVLVEAVASGKRSSVAVYENQLAVEMIENYGLLQVRHKNKHQPLPKVYVKIYARMNDGNVQFYKDGYTDLRGKFDYVSLSTDQLDQVEKLSILIMSDEHGSLVKEVKPPQR